MHSVFLQNVYQVKTINVTKNIYSKFVPQASFSNFCCSLITIILVEQLTNYSTIVIYILYCELRYSLSHSALHLTDDRLVNTLVESFLHFCLIASSFKLW